MLRRAVLRESRPCHLGGDVPSCYRACCTKHHHEIGTAVRLTDQRSAQPDLPSMFVKWDAHCTADLGYCGELCDTLASNVRRIAHKVLA